MNGSFYTLFIISNLGHYTKMTYSSYAHATRAAGRKAMQALIQLLRDAQCVLAEVLVLVLFLISGYHLVRDHWNTPRQPLGSETTKDEDHAYGSDSSGRGRLVAMRKRAVIRSARRFYTKLHRPVSKEP